MTRTLLRAQSILEAGGELDRELTAELQLVFADLRPTMVRLCCRLLRDDVAGEEVAQDALGEAWRKLGEYRDEGTFAAWVGAFARNLCRNRLRKWTDVLTDDGDLDPASPELDVLRQMGRIEREDLLEEAIGTLPILEQEVLRLYALGRTYSEIDQALGLAGTGARNQLTKARRRVGSLLRELLEKRGHGSSFFWTTLP